MEIVFTSSRYRPGTILFTNSVSLNLAVTVAQCAARCNTRSRTLRRIVPREQACRMASGASERDADSQCDGGPSSNVVMPSQSS